MNKILIAGYVWKSQQNGAVYDTGGYLPVLTVEFMQVLNLRFWR